MIGMAAIEPNWPEPKIGCFHSSFKSATLSALMFESATRVLAKSPLGDAQSPAVLGGDLLSDFDVESEWSPPHPAATNAAVATTASGTNTARWMNRLVERILNPLRMLVAALLSASAFRDPLPTHRTAQRGDENHACDVSDQARTFRRPSRFRAGRAATDDVRLSSSGRWIGGRAGATRTGARVMSASFRAVRERNVVRALPRLRAPRTIAIPLRSLARSARRGLTAPTSPMHVASAPAS